MKTLIILVISTVMLSSCREKQVSSQTAGDDVTVSTPIADSGQISGKVRQDIAFDVPTLLRLSIPQVKKKLGPPADELQANVTDTERSLVYNRNDIQLTINYIVETNRIDNIGLAAKRDTTAYAYLEPLGNLSRLDTAYVIEPQQGEKVGQYHGILIKPNPPVEFPVAP